MIVWHVDITSQAESDISEIYSYIAFTLEEPNIAWKQTMRIRNGINTLCSMPDRFPIIDDEPWKSLGVRRLSIDNYIAFYVLGNESDTVRVFRVLYARRDFSSITMYGD